MTSLKEIVDSQSGKVVDKWFSYLGNYETILQSYQDKPINLLEIGIANGGSLDVWSKYFSKANHIVGCDINPACGSLKYDDERVSVVVGDANEPATIGEIKSISERFDVIIDDGSHINSDVIKSFSLYYPLLNYNGLYIVEDLHTSYWDRWGGGLRNPLSSMAFFKRLADMPNYEHWRIRRTRRYYLIYLEQACDTEFHESDLATIQSLTFLNSLVVIRKMAADECKLGRRVVRGDDEHVMPHLIEIDGIDIKLIVADGVDDWQYDPFAMIQRNNQLGEQSSND